nr:hypothetical protein [Candidatus Sigynarchaeota archaeon]
MNTGQSIRIRDITDETGSALVLDFTRGFLGSEFKNITDALSNVTEENTDAIILSPGEAQRHNDIICKKRVPFIVKCDWSNRLLDERSLYPAQRFRQVLACSAADVLRFGASAAVIDVFFGTPDIDTVEGIQALRALVEGGAEAGLPVIASIIPFGSRVSKDNYADVIGLGMRVCLEIGATTAAVPVVAASDARKLVAASSKCPLFANAAFTSPLAPVNNFAVSVKAMRSEGIPAVIIDGFNLPAPVDELRRMFFNH